MTCLYISLEHKFFILLSASPASFIQKAMTESLNIFCVPGSVMGHGGMTFMLNEHLVLWEILTKRKWILSTCRPKAFHSGGKTKTGLEIRRGSWEPCLCCMTHSLYLAMDQRWTLGSDWTSYILRFLVAKKWDSEVASCYGLNCVSCKFVCWSPNP